MRKHFLTLKANTGRMVNSPYLYSAFPPSSKAKTLYSLKPVHTFTFLHWWWLCFWTLAGGRCPRDKVPKNNSTQGKAGIWPAIDHPTAAPKSPGWRGVSSSSLFGANTQYTNTFSWWHFCFCFENINVCRTSPLHHIFILKWFSPSEMNVHCLWQTGPQCVR